MDENGSELSGAATHLLLTQARYGLQSKKLLENLGLGRFGGSGKPRLVESPSHSFPAFRFAVAHSIGADCIIVGVGA